MADNITRQHRSWVMSRIRGGGTKPELIVRSMLHRAGYRFSLRSARLPGRPDIVMPKFQTVVLVHGCFWHNHRGCSISKVPKSNTEFWQRKLQANMERDRKARSQLRRLGWNIIVVWECQVMRDPGTVLKRIMHHLEKASGEPRRVYQTVERGTLLKAAEKRLHRNLKSKTSEWPLTRHQPA
jgi:DNA mismatch endonuclease, patch repair protein